MTYDLKIRGGTLYDGSGSPGYGGDVGIRDGRVEALGDAPEGAHRTIDASDPATVAAGPLERVNDLPGGAQRVVSRPRGMQAVVVNGTVLPPPGEAFEAGTKLPGRVLRHGRASSRL